MPNVQMTKATCVTENFSDLSAFRFHSTFNHFDIRHS